MCISCVLSPVLLFRIAALFEHEMLSFFYGGSIINLFSWKLTVVVYDKETGKRRDVNMKCCLQPTFMVWQNELFMVIALKTDW